MLEIPINIVPYGQKDQERTLCKMVIINDGTGDTFFGNYRIRLSKFDGQKGLFKKGTIVCHPRNQTPYHLVMKGLAEVLGYDLYVKRRKKKLSRVRG